MHTRFVCTAIPYIGAEPRPRHGILATRKITIDIRMKLNLKMNIIIKINIKRQ